MTQVNTIQSTTTLDLILESIEKGYKKVKVIFKKIEATDFPEITHNLPSVKKCIGTQKVEFFDVVNETGDILWLLNNRKDVQDIFFHS
jgi:hypothetical protein